MGKFRYLAATALCAAALFPAAAEAIPLSAGETLRVRFSFAAPPQSPQLPANHAFSVADTLFGLLDAAYLSGFGALSATFTLYDGAALLGSFPLVFSPPFTSFGFAGPGSPYSFRAGAATTFATVDDGTIDGVLDITSTSSALYDFSLRHLDAAHAFDANNLHILTPRATILSQTLLVDESIPAPEPGALLLFAAGLAGLGAARRAKCAPS